MSKFAAHLAEFCELMPRADVILPGRPLNPGAPAEEIAGLRATGSGTLDGAAAYGELERRARLDLMEAAGRVAEIEHRNRPS